MDNERSEWTLKYDKSLSYALDSNAGAMLSKRARPRGGAQTKVSDGELLVAGESKWVDTGFVNKVLEWRNWYTR